MSSMMWIIVLLVLALLAYFVVRALMNKSGGDTANYDGASSSSGHATDGNNAAKQATDATGNAAGATAAAAGAIATGAAAAATTAVSSVAESASAATSAVTQAASQAAASATQTTSYAVSTDDAAHDVREMMKILNLRAGDASRLGIDKDQFEQLKAAGNVDSAIVDSVAGKLRHMLS